MNDVVVERVPYARAAIVVFVVCVALWVLNGVLLFHWIKEPAERGLFGDMFGAVNAIFSGLSFAGVIYAVILQRHEISLAHKELSRTNQIIEEQRKQIEIQNETAKLTSFEGTFFQMLNFLQDIISEMRYEGKMGKEVFSALVFIFEDVTPVDGDIENGHFDGRYEDFYHDFRNKIGHYYRFLYNILKFIDQSSVQNKIFYTYMLRSQLSDAESRLLFWQGLSKNGNQSLKPLLEKYHMLRKVPFDEVLIPFQKHYDASAFSAPFNK